MTAVCALLLSVSGYADRCDLHWDNDKASGSFTDPAMWETSAGKPSSDFDKGASRNFRIETKQAGTNTVVLSDCNLLGGIKRDILKQNEIGFFRHKVRVQNENWKKLQFNDVFLIHFLGPGPEKWRVDRSTALVFSLYSMTGGHSIVG